MIDIAIAAEETDSIETTLKKLRKLRELARRANDFEKVAGCSRAIWRIVGPQSWGSNFSVDTTQPLWPRPR